MTDTIAAVVVAGGRGLRAGGDVPKQYREIAGEPVIRPALAAFLHHPQIGAVQPVIHPQDEEVFRSATAGLKKLLPPVWGGATRQASVRAGLEAFAASAPAIVLIHDAARPFLTEALIGRAIVAARQNGAAVPAIAIADTVKKIDDTAHVTETLDRNHLRMVQTPQAFVFDLIMAAHRRAAAAGRDDFSDDAALAEWAGHRVSVFEGEAGNVKLTTNDDFARAEMLRHSALADVRTGNGFDVHAFADGDHVMLGGVRIPHSRGVTGHSDADVALHALVDAILGALAEGDIGQHFPPSDPQWKGASSDRFLAFACERVRARGGIIANLDVTVVCEAPRVSPHRDAMRERIAAIAGISASPRRHQGDDQRETRLHRARRRACGDGDGNGAVAVERDVIGADLREAAKRVLELCRARGLHVATAESCTGGLVAAALTEIPGSSDVVDRGFVTYSDDAKRAMLGVPAATLKRHGAVSAQTAKAMAAGALKNSRADLAVSITGIAGPGGGSKQKPVGLVHFAAASRDGRRIARKRLYGEIGRRRVRLRSVAEALALLQLLSRPARRKGS